MWIFLVFWTLFRCISCWNTFSGPFFPSSIGVSDANLLIFSISRHQQGRQSRLLVYKPFTSCLLKHKFKKGIKVHSWWCAIWTRFWWLFCAERSIGNRQFSRFTGWALRLRTLTRKWKVYLLNICSINLETWRGNEAVDCSCAWQKDLFTFNWRNKCQLLHFELRARTLRCQ